MAMLSDLIENFIKQLLCDANGTVEIQRNELAGQFKCAPSQINYVISTRFTCEKGYYVESRRGGGGYISIKRVNLEFVGPSLMHIISSIGNKISGRECEVFIDNFVGYKVITSREGSFLKAALNDKALRGIPLVQRDFVRAEILKSMLISLAV